MNDFSPTIHARPRSRSKSHYSESSRANGRPWRDSSRRETPTSLARELGDCVYFLRSSDDLIKIGFTSDLVQRKRRFAGSTWSDILAVIPGTIEDEQHLHQMFAVYRARGDEWYRPVAPIIEHINGIRSRLNVSPIESW